MRTTRGQQLDDWGGNRVPLSQEDAELIAKKIKPAAEGYINIFDPFCFHGKHLSMLAGRFQEAYTYGAEPDSYDRSFAKRILTKTVLGDYRQVWTTSGMFSILFLNPPQGGKNLLNISREAASFGDLTHPGKILYAGSVVIYIVTANILNLTAHLASIRLENIRLFKTNDRVIMIAQKSRGRILGALAKQQEAVLKQITIDQIPSLGAEYRSGGVIWRRITGTKEYGWHCPMCYGLIYNEWDTFAFGDPEHYMSKNPDLIWKQNVPIKKCLHCHTKLWQKVHQEHIVVPAAARIKTFRGEHLDNEDIQDGIEASPVWDEIARALTPVSTVVVPPKPLMPLNETHIATAIAAGAVNGRAGNHYRKGVTRELVDQIRVEEEDRITTVSTTRHVSRVLIFSQEQHNEGAFELKN